MIFVIKNCIVYTYPKGKISNYNIDQNNISNSNFSNVLKSAKGTIKPKIKSLIEIAKKESIDLDKEENEHHVISTSCQFKVPKLLAAGISPFVDTNYKIWLRKKSNFVVTFDAGRKLSGVGTVLLSNAIFNNPSFIQNIKLEKEHFLKIKNWFLGSEEPGQLKQMTMNKIDHEGLRFKKITLSADRLETSSIFKMLIEPAMIISNMSFFTPPLKSTKRPLSCKINNWGSITIYTPGLLDNEISELITNLEKILNL